MNDETKKPDEPVLQCSVCLKEIPKSLVKSEEVQEYVYYFCGDECYSQWETNGKTELNKGKD